MQQEIALLNSEMATIRDVLLAVIGIIPSFDITDQKVLPYGLKAHTRSICWIVEHRSRAMFLRLLRQKSRSIVLK